MYKKKDEKRVCQGDIFENVPYRLYLVDDNELKINEIILPFLVVLSQECDLLWDFENREKLGTDYSNHDKFLQSVLVCPAYLGESFRSGDHLKDLGLKMQNWNTDLWKNIKQNKNERFHYLPINEELKIPELIIDFKHYYTLNRSEIYAKPDSYKVSLDILFREDLSRRFANYLSRIGLPVIKNSESSTDD